MLLLTVKARDRVACNALDDAVRTNASNKRVLGDVDRSVGSIGNRQAAVWQCQEIPDFSETVEQWRTVGILVAGEQLQGWVCPESFSIAEVDDAGVRVVRVVN